MKKQQRTFSRVLSYIKPYWASVTLNVVFNLMAIFFSLFSFALVGPSRPGGFAIRLP